MKQTGKISHPEMSKMKPHLYKSKVQKVKMAA